MTIDQNQIQERKEKEHTDGLRKAIQILEQRIRSLEHKTRSQDANVRRISNDLARANTTIVQMSKILNRG